MTTQTKNVFPKRIRYDTPFGGSAGSSPKEKPKAWKCLECDREFTGMMMCGMIGWDYGKRKGPWCDGCMDWLTLGARAQEFIDKYGSLNEERLQALGRLEKS